MRLSLTIVSIFLLLSTSAQTVNYPATTVSLKDYIDMQAEMNRKLFGVQFDNIEKNVAKANDANEKRFEGVFISKICSAI